VFIELKDNNIHWLQKVRCMGNEEKQFDFVANSVLNEEVHFMGCMAIKNEHSVCPMMARLSESLEMG
jgi:hypothetical protein